MSPTAMLFVFFVVFLLLHIPIYCPIFLFWLMIN